jgi:hypothetical protein
VFAEVTQQHRTSARSHGQQRESVLLSSCDGMSTATNRALLRAESTPSRHGAPGKSLRDWKPALSGNSAEAVTCSLTAESFVERVAGFDRDRSSEATRGHRPLIEESDASEPVLHGPATRAKSK